MEYNIKNLEDTFKEFFKSIEEIGKEKWRRIRYMRKLDIRDFK